MGNVWVCTRTRTTSSPYMRYGPTHEMRTRVLETKLRISSGLVASQVRIGRDARDLSIF